MKTTMRTVTILFTLVALLLGGPAPAAQSPVLPDGGQSTPMAELTPIAQPSVQEIGPQTEALPGGAHPTQTVLAAQGLMFIENVGQFADGARFQVWGGPGVTWLADDGLWITLIEERKDPNRVRSSDHEQLTPRLRGEPEDREPRGAVHLRLSFPGSNPSPRLEPFGRVETTVSYFLGNDPDGWRPDVPVWAGVRYVDLYPGLDLEISGEGGRWAWRMAARNNAGIAALDRVRLRIEGAEEARAAEGFLRLTTALGKAALPLLSGAATGHPAPKVQAGPHGFELSAPYAVGEPATRMQGVHMAGQPTNLLYATFLGGSGQDTGHALAVEVSGAAYVAGSTRSSGFPTTPGAFDTSLNEGWSDAFVVKLNAAGSALVYATFLGGSDKDEGHGLAVDSSGVAYVSGSTSSTDFPTTPGAFDTSHNGDSKAFVVKLNAAGSALVYATFLGGSSGARSTGIAVDESGAVYVTGNTGSDFPTTPGAFDTSHNGSSDAFVVKLNAAGSALVYSTFLGGSSSDWSHDLTVDASGAAYVVGTTSSPDFPTTPGAFDPRGNLPYRLSLSQWDNPDHAQMRKGVTVDAFVVKLNAAGSDLVYATFLGGSYDDAAESIVVDASGAAYVAGQTNSLDFPTTPGAFDTSCDGIVNAFVVKLNVAGSDLVYATFLGGHHWTKAFGLGVDVSGAAYVTGETYSADFPTTPGAFDTLHNGAVDAFVVKLNPDGSALAYATFLGGSDWDWGTSLAMDASGFVYVTGSTTSLDFPTTPGSFDTSHNGEIDVFLAKLNITSSDPVVIDPDDYNDLEESLRAISLSWDQYHVDRANSILSNKMYDASIWRGFFGSYFARYPLTDHLRRYLEHPTLWWFDRDVHENLQYGLIPVFQNWIEFIISENLGDLGFAFSTDKELRMSIFNAHGMLGNIALHDVIHAQTRQQLFDWYIGQVAAHPELWLSSATIDFVAQPHVARLKAQMHIILVDLLPLTPARKQDIATALDLRAPRDAVWFDHSVLLIDNNGLDDQQVAAIAGVLDSIPPELHNLATITVNDFLGDFPDAGEIFRWFVSRAGINIFGLRVGAASENQFPPDIAPIHVDVFTIVVVHEVNHVVDAFTIGRDDRVGARRDALIARTGDVSLEYLRSMFDGEFFSKYPQEFFASISNQWFANTRHTLDLAIMRWNAGYREPINQFLFFAEVYSQGKAMPRIPFYTMQSSAPIPTETPPIPTNTPAMPTNTPAIPTNTPWPRANTSAHTAKTALVGNLGVTYATAGRDSEGRINYLWVDGQSFSFDLDEQGNVTGITIGDEGPTLTPSPTATLTTTPTNTATMTPTPTGEAYPAPVTFTPTPRIWGAHLPMILKDAGAPSTVSLIVNGGFEESFGWELPITPYRAAYSSAQARSGRMSMRLGIVDMADNRHRATRRRSSG